MMRARFYTVALAVGLLISPVVARPAPAKPKPVLNAVWVDGQGNGLLRMWDYHHDSSDDTFRFGTRLVEGFTTFVGHSTLKSLRTLVLHGLFQARPDHLEVTGNVHYPFTGHSAITGDLTSSVQYSQGASTGTARFNLTFPWERPIPLTVVDVEGGGTLTGYKAWDGQLHVHLVGDLIKAQVVPAFTSADFHLGQDGDVSTVRAAMTVPGGSPLADVFKAMGADAATAQASIRAQLVKGGLDVQDVQVTHLRANDQEAGADVTLVVKGLEQSLHNGLNGLLTDKTSKEASAMMDQILVLKVQSLDMHAAAHDGDLDVTTHSSLANVDRLIQGALKAYRQLFDRIGANKKRDRVDAYMAKAAQRSFDDLQKVLEAAAAQNSADSATFEGAVHYSNDGHVHTVHASFDGHGDSHGLVSAMQQMQYPSLQAQTQQFNLKFDSQALDGDLKVAWDGPWLDVLRRAYVAAAQESPGLEGFGTALQGLQWLDSRIGVDIENGNVQVQGTIQNNDLTALVGSILHFARPGLKADLTAFDLSVNNPFHRTSWARADFYWRNLPSDALADLRHLMPQELKRANVKTVPSSALVAPPLAKPGTP